MKENRYDDPIFFQKYSKMQRSVEGLSGAGEWPALKKLLPDFSKKRVLDLGCGFGWHCKYAADQGAAQVLGIDLSKRMLKQARIRHTAPNISYLQMALEDYTYPENSFDVVLSSLALHYVFSFSDICSKVAQCLTPGGIFVFSVEHPIFTAYGNQDWMYDADGSILCWPVDRYFSEGKREAVFLGERMIKYHRTLTTYLNTLLQTGFSIESVVEPMPSDEMLPHMPDELRRPMMLLVSAKKKE